MDRLHSKYIEPSHKTTIISVDNNISLEDWSLEASDLGIEGANWDVKMIELKGGKQEGVQLIKVDNGAMEFTVIPTRGMNIYSVKYGDITLGWDSPVKEFVHPKFIDLEDNGGLGWLDGFNEWMARCGIEFAGHPGLDDGRMLSLHGKIANIPASEVQVIVDENPPHRIRIRGKVNEVWFNGPNLELWTEISTIPGTNSFQINDVITNRSGKEQEFMIIYHANFGKSLLEKGSQLFGTIEKVVPFNDWAAKDVENWGIYSDPVLGIAERVYCLYISADEDGKSHFLLQNTKADKGVAFSFPKDQLPYLTQWKNMDSNGYVTGLEPGTSFPHNRAVERKHGRVPVLKPGESRTFNLEYTLLANETDVTKRRERIIDLTKNEIEVESKIIEK